MGRTLDEYREWLAGVSRTRNGEDRPFTDEEKHFLMMAFYGGWHRGNKAGKEEA